MKKLLLFTFLIFIHIQWILAQKKGEFYVVRNSQLLGKIFIPYDPHEGTCDDDAKKSAPDKTVFKIADQITFNTFEVIITETTAKDSKVEVSLNEHYCLDKSVITGNGCGKYTIAEPAVFKDLINYRVINMLVSTGILNENPETLSGNAKKVELRMRERIKAKYNPPQYFLTDQVAMVLRDQNPAYLGSTVFDGPFTDPSNTLPKLPIVSNYKQLLISSPSRSNFSLYYSITDLTNMTVDMDVSGGVAELLVAKINNSINTQEQRKRSISVTSGLFENQLAEVFKRIKSTFIEESDWTSAFELWEMYKSENFPVPNKLGIIENFEATVISEKNDSEFSSKIDFSSTLSGNYSAIPFFKVSGEANADWSKETKTNVNFSIYDIYLKAQPKLVGIPVPDNIYKSWLTKSSRLQTSYDLVLTPNDETNVLELEFGPITSDTQLKYITPLVTDYFKLFNDKNNIIKEVQIGETRFSKEKNRAYVSLRFIYNDDFIKTLANSLAVSNNLKVTLGSKVNNLELEKTYKINLSVEGTYIPLISDTDHINPEATVTGNTHEWNFEIFFENAAEKFANEDILRAGLTFTDDRLKFLNEPPYFKSATCRPKSGSDNAFLVKIKLDIPKEKITANDRSINVTMNLKPKTVKNQIFSRPLGVKLTNIQVPDVSTTAEIIVPDMQKLAEVLKGDYKLESGETIGELRKKLSIEDFNVRLQKIISELKIRYEPNKGYTVKSDLIEMKKNN